jgi:hypothetical protein
VRSAAGDPWTARYELERLTQLRADVESACERYMTECIRAAAKVSDYDAQMWMQKASNIEQARNNLVRDIDQWIETWCREQGEPPGC